MRIDPVAAVEQVPRKVASWVASFAVAMTIMRFGTAHFQAEREARAFVEA